MRRWVPEILVAALVAVAYGVGLSVGPYGGMVKGILTLAAVAIVPAVRYSGTPWERELRLLFGVSVVAGVASIATGFGNNSTDEPFTMAGYLSLLLHGKDPYTTAAWITFTPHALGISSATVSAPFHYVYLPLLLFVQVPGTGSTGYKALCLACWAAIVVLVRRDEVAGLCLASPMVALVAANGFTDLPVLALMTFSLRGARGTPGRAAEYASYAMKQFANLFWLGLYLVRRELARAAMVVVVTLALCAPFLLWHPSGLWCAALTFNSGPGCTGGTTGSSRLSGLYLHWNYYLWVLWIYALYEREIRAVGGRARRALRRSHAASGGDRSEGPTVPAAPETVPAGSP